MSQADGQGFFCENSCRDIDLCELAEHYEYLSGWTPQPHTKSLLQTRIWKTIGKFVWNGEQQVHEFRNCGAHFPFFSALGILKEEKNNNSKLGSAFLN